MSEGNNHNVKRVVIGIISVVAVVGTIVGAVLWRKAPKNGEQPGKAD